MPAPFEFHVAFMAELASALSPAIDKAWEAGQRAVRTGVITPPVKPTPKPRGPRLGRGAARQAVMAAIRAYDDKGASRSDLRRVVPQLTKLPVSENTLKKVLMVLREEGKIETRNSRWWPVK